MAGGVRGGYSVANGGGGGIVATERRLAAADLCG